MSTADGTIGPDGPYRKGDALLVEVMEAERAGPPPAARPRRRWRLMGAVAVAALVAYGASWAIVPPLTHEIDTDTAFAPPTPQGGSASVAMAAALVDREVNLHGWTPNDPPFLPSAALDNMPNFQEGVVRATSWFTMELLDQLGRVRGSSSIDRDLERAAGLLQVPPDIWVIDPETSLLPVASSEEQYRIAVELLERYNTRVAAGQGVFELRADALATTVQRMSVELASQATMIDRMQAGEGGLLNRSADDLFYHNLGMVYAYYMILTGLGTDFQQIISERGLRPGWEQALSDLRNGSQLRPLVVLDADSQRGVFANHLMLQGFHMKRAILQLEEVVNVLAV